MRLTKFVAAAILVSSVSAVPIPAPIPAPNLLTEMISSWGTKVSSLADNFVNKFRKVAPQADDAKKVAGEGKNLGGEGTNLGDEGTNLGGEGKNLGDEGTNLGGEGKNFGDEGTNLGGEGKNLGDESADGFDVNGQSGKASVTDTGKALDDKAIDSYQALSTKLKTGDKLTKLEQTELDNLTAGLKKQAKGTGSQADEAKKLLDEYKPLSVPGKVVQWAGDNPGKAIIIGAAAGVGAGLVVGGGVGYAVGDRDRPATAKDETSTAEQVGTSTPVYYEASPPVYYETSPPVYDETSTSTGDGAE